MSNKSFIDKGFSPDWLEIDLRQPEVSEDAAVNKEVSLESKQRKDLTTLLKELDEIKQSIERAAEKQHRLANLVGFYTGELAQ